MASAKSIQQYEELRRVAAGIPQSQKEAYLDGLSEDDFRDKVVRPIFRCLNFSDGRDTCGPDEMGRDAIFTQTSPLTGLEITVVQTKKGNITKGSRPSENLDSIVAQLRTAVTTPVKQLDKTKKLPLRGFLVTSGEIKSSARDYICDEIKDSRLEFLDGPKLIPLIDEHTPELWLNIDSDVLPYFRTIVHALEQNADILPSVSNPLNIMHSVASDDYFTDVAIYKPPKAVPYARKQKKGEPPKVDSLPVTDIVKRRERLVLLSGDGGCGKSTALKRILYEAAARPLTTKKGMKIPLLVRAKDIAARPEVPLIEHAYSFVKSLGADLKSPFSTNDLGDGNVVMLVDGLDEVADKDLADAVVENVAQFAKKNPKCQLILTSRPTETTKGNVELRGFDTFYFAPLSGQQIKRLVNAYATMHSLDEYDSADIIKRLGQLHGVELNPLIVTIFVATSSVDRSDIPANISQLFSKYTHLMLGLWDEGKGLAQQIDAPLKHYVVARVALRMHESQNGSWPLSDFRQHVYDELASRGYAENSEALYEEIIVRSNLFRVHDETVEFRHLIIQEYFAGIAMTGINQVLAVATQPWWRHALVFYFGTRPGELGELSKLAEIVANSDFQALSAISVVGLSLQACYIAQLDEKKVVYQLLIESLARLRSSNNELTRVLGEFPIALFGTLTLLMRDTPALANARQFAPLMMAQVEQNREGLSDDYAFWLLIGLIESGQFKTAKAQLERYKFRDSLFMFALSLEMTLISVSRIMSEVKRKELAALTESVNERLVLVLPDLKPRLDEERERFKAALPAEVRRELGPAAE